MKKDEVDYEEILKRNFEIPRYVDMALIELKKTTKKGKSILVAEAILHMAKAAGVEIHGPAENKALGLPEIAKKQSELVKTVKSLARLHCNYAFEETEDKVRKMLQDAVDEGTKRDVAILWKKLETEFSEMDLTKDDIQAFKVAYGIPPKTKKKHKS